MGDVPWPGIGQTCISPSRAVGIMPFLGVGYRIFRHGFSLDVAERARLESACDSLERTLGKGHKMNRKMLWEREC
ncbi:hypothetical protein D3C80_2062930 [compost metagenome]